MVIGACEIGFWVFLAAGLATRYLLRWRTVSKVLLICVPLVDVVLLVVTVIDLGKGAEASFTHGLAAAYLGFSVAFGHSMMRWADQRFAHRFANGPAPWKPPKSGPERVRHEWREWGKCVLACGIACAVMAVLIFMVSTPQHTTALWQGMMPKLALITGIWLLWPLTTSRKPAA
ncbi:hypothetical protein EV192_1011642 [Actinocrispum wychmicini]|uniref:Uncharacterized protein n=2 Tax=Actinocrispum wychmicini TaxID=1213861 RepID=A0A4V2S8Z8_9PSEU|nr:hypothetical protein EV192_1011642 [Actinocrispum wychmicini]